MWTFSCLQRALRTGCVQSPDCFHKDSAVSHSLFRRSQEDIFYCSCLESADLQQKKQDNMITCNDYCYCSPSFCTLSHTSFKFSLLLNMLRLIYLHTSSQFSNPPCSNHVQIFTHRMFPVCFLLHWYHLLRAHFLPRVKVLTRWQKAQHWFRDQ